MKHHFILDFETMGADCLRVPAVDVSYFIFDWDRFISDVPYSFEELLSKVHRYKFSVEEQVTKFKFDLRTSDMTWWQNQGKEAKKYIFSTDNDRPVDEFFTELFAYIRDMESDSKLEYWWSRSGMFEPVMLNRLANATDNTLLLNEYLKFWRNRDIRTFIDTKFNFTTLNGFTPIKDKEYWSKMFKAHDSRHDVIADILRLQSITRAEADMEMVDK